MNSSEHFSKKRNWLPVLALILVFVFVFVFVLNVFKHPYVFYLPFDMPGSLMASTVPPFGIFIQAGYKNENPVDPCSILTHEMVHWKQYERMGLVTFYYNYLKCYIQSGRIHNWMEEEARGPCREKRHLP